ncbi:hypothetical protein, partial [Ornithinibacter sp.]|uniref:hypothetical protein n=1 Tax=Ornithinibacter sp. TaxID=2862748 RepID=UPI002CA5E0EB
MNRLGVERGVARSQGCKGACRAESSLGQGSGAGCEARQLVRYGIDLGEGEVVIGVQLVGQVEDVVRRHVAEQ